MMRWYAIVAVVMVVILSSVPARADKEPNGPVRPEIGDDTSRRP